MGWVSEGDVSLKTKLEIGSEIGLQRRKFPVRLAVVYADMGSFDCVAASLRGAVTPLRMTGLHHQEQVSIVRGHVITPKSIQ